MMKQNHKRYKISRSARALGLSAILLMLAAPAYAIEYMEYEELNAALASGDVTVSHDVQICGSGEV